MRILAGGPDPRWLDCEVFLNGKQLTGVVEADDSEGWVRHLAYGPDGIVRLDNRGEIATVLHRAPVRIEVLPPWSGMTDRELIGYIDDIKDREIVAPNGVPYRVFLVYDPMWMVKPMYDIQKLPFWRAALWRLTGR